MANLDAQANLLASQTDRQKELSGWTSSITDFCGRVQGGLANATFEQKRQLVELLIDRVVVTGEEVEIRYAIPTGPEGEHTRFCQLRKDYFHGPSHSGQVRQFLRGALLRCVAQIKLGFRLCTQRATEDRPITRPRQLVAQRRDTHEGQLDQNRTFAALLDLSAMPSGSIQLSQQGSHFKWPWGGQLYARIEARTPGGAGSRRFDGRGAQPSAGTSARYHLPKAALPSKNTGIFP